LFDETLSPNEKKVFALLRADEMTHIDELMDRLAPMSSSEVFAALFELELASKIRQLPGKHYVRTF
jgi:DNA processing protein